MPRRPRNIPEESGPRPLGEVVKKIVSKAAKRGADARAEAERKWNEVVGPGIAAHTRVAGFDRRVLKVAVDSSSLLAELSGFHREALLESLQSGERPLPATDIRFELDGEK